MPSMMDYFEMEATERLTQLGAGLLKLESTPRDEELLNLLFREAHSLKGAAAVTGLADVARVCHAMEDTFSELRNGTVRPNSRFIDHLLSATDAVKELISAESGELASGRTVDQVVRQLEETRTATWAAELAVGSTANAATGNVEDSSRAPTAPGPEAGSVSTSVNGAIDPSEAKTVPGEDKGAAVVQSGADPNVSSELASQSGPVAPSSGGDVVTTGSGSLDSVRLPVQSLDQLANLTGELFVAHDRLRQRLDTIKQTYHALRSACDGGHGSRSEIEWIPSMAESVRCLADTFAGDLTIIEPLVAEVHDRVLETRMLPLQVLFDSLPRFVRDFCRQAGKQVSLHVEGADTRVDRHVLEELRDPITQLVRNAIDHGIEPPDERTRLGKPPTGSLRLVISRWGDRIRLVCEDDGRGIDRQQVLDHAVAADRISRRDAEEFSDEQIDRLVFVAGLSTADRVTDVSGRGVGMDIVANRISLLRGSIRVDSEPGKGTRFLLELPAGVATLESLLVDIGPNTYVIPTSFVEGVAQLEVENLRRGAGGELMFQWQDRPTVVRSLATLLGGPPIPISQRASVPLVVVRHEGQPIALAVERLLTTQTVVAKAVPSEVGNSAGVTGATILGSGVPALILDPARLLGEHSAPVNALDLTDTNVPSSEEAGPLLVVDDSVTTRMMEKSILESAGYDVEIAVSAEDALQKISHTHFRLIVTDVEMPGMDGFELTRTLRRDDKHSETPIIVVSSLSSEAERRQGLEAGANAFIVKGEFDQKMLLSTIERLVGS